MGALRVATPVVVAAASERQKYERDLSGGTSHEGVAESAAQLAKAANPFSEALATNTL